MLHGYQNIGNTPVLTFSDGYHEWHSLMDDTFGAWPEELAVEDDIMNHFGK